DDAVDTQDVQGAGNDFCCRGQGVDEPRLDAGLGYMAHECRPVARAIALGRFEAFQQSFFGDKRLEAAGGAAATAAWVTGNRRVSELAAERHWIGVEFPV